MHAIAPHDGVGLLAIAAAGVAGSLHCVLMCGPLACAPLAGRTARRWSPIAGWQAGRLSAYSLLGAGLGLVGEGLARGISERLQPFVPWLMVVGLVASGFEFGRRFPPLPALSGMAHRVAGWVRGRSAFSRAFGLGAVTPLLPCGLLWGIFLVAVGAGSPLGGALVMAIFAMASALGLAVVQVGVSWSGRWPRGERALRRAVPLAAAAIVAWRTLTLGDGGAPSGQPHP